MDGSLRPILEMIVEAVRSSEAYRSYNEARQQVEADEVLCRLMKQYEHIQRVLQTAALAQSEPDAKDVEEFRRLNLLLLDNDKASAYLMAKMKYDHTLSEVYEYLSSGLEFSLAEQED